MNENENTENQEQTETHTAREVELERELAAERARREAVEAENRRLFVMCGGDSDDNEKTPSEFVDDCIRSCVQNRGRVVYA